MNARANKLFRAAVTLVVAASTLIPGVSHASLVCQELMQDRACTDNVEQLSPGTVDQFDQQGTAITAPASGATAN